jgi:hypothetical protein
LGEHIQPASRRGYQYHKRDMLLPAPTARATTPPKPGKPPRKKDLSFDDPAWRRHNTHLNEYNNKQTLPQEGHTQLPQARHTISYKSDNICPYISHRSTRILERKACWKICSDLDYKRRTVPYPRTSSGNLVDTEVMNWLEKRKTRGGGGEV